MFIINVDPKDNHTSVEVYDCGGNDKIVDMLFLRLDYKNPLYDAGSKYHDGKGHAWIGRNGNSFVAIGPSKEAAATAVIALVRDVWGGDEADYVEAQLGVTNKVSGQERDRLRSLGGVDGT